MKRHRPVTKDLIRKYFGRSAKILGFYGHYRVKTDSGGEVVISPNHAKIIFGGDDTYKALTLLMGECWGGAKASGGSREFMLGAMAHGEAWGVNIRPDYRDKGAAFARAVVFLLIVLVGFGLGAGKDAFGLLVTVFMAVVVVAAMARSAKRKEQAQAEAMGFHYPRVQGSARFSDDEDLEKGGLL